MSPLQQHVNASEPTRLSWIDIGANLTNSAFADDLEEVLREAQSVGVDRIVVTGTSLTESRAALALAHRFPRRLYSTAGVHPHDARHWDTDSEAGLRALTPDPAVRAIGETGLDFNRDFSPRPDQERAFEAQLALAAETGLPVFVHERDANERVMAILRAYRDDLVDGVVHCFTGERAALRGYLDLDLHIGVTGWICDERRGSSLQACVGDIPDHRLLLETDAPYLLPRTLRPRPKRNRNVPAYLIQVAEAVAQHRGQPVGTVAEHTRRNAMRFFRLPAP